MYARAAQSTCSSSVLQLLGQLVTDPRRSRVTIAVGRAAGTSTDRSARQSTQRVGRPSTGHTACTISNSRLAPKGETWASLDFYCRGLRSFPVAKRTWLQSSPQQSLHCARAPKRPLNSKYFPIGVNFSTLSAKENWEASLCTRSTLLCRECFKCGRANRRVVSNVDQWNEDIFFLNSALRSAAAAASFFLSSCSALISSSKADPLRQGMLHR